MQVNLLQTAATIVSIASLSAADAKVAHADQPKDKADAGQKTFLLCCANDSVPVEINVADHSRMRKLAAALIVCRMPSFPPRTEPDSSGEFGYRVDAILAGRLAR